MEADSCCGMSLLFGSAKNRSRTFPLDVAASGNGCAFAFSTRELVMLLSVRGVVLPKLVHRLVARGTGSTKIGYQDALNYAVFMHQVVFSK